MNASVVLFYLLAACILGFGVLAVTARKIFRAAVFLLFSLLGVAGLYFLLDYEFIGAVQIIVYVGGIVVLLIFSIFLTHGSGGHMKRPRPLRMIFAGLTVAAAYALTIAFVNNQQFSANDKPAVQATAGEIGTQMLSTTDHGYLLPFEVVSFLLLAAMVGCIVIAVKIKLPPQQVLNAEVDDRDDKPAVA
jgi:NADH-quinone oxidoreductase subunit J